MDPLSGVSLPLLSFILTHGLEVKHYLANASRVMPNEIHMGDILYDEGSVKTVLTGSAPEGLSLERHSDIDIMTVIKLPIYTSCKRDIDCPLVTKLGLRETCRKECEPSHHHALTVSDHAYLFIEDTDWHGYHFIRKCRNTDQSYAFEDRYVNAAQCADAHIKDIDEYWEKKNVQEDPHEDPIETMQHTQYRPQRRFTRHGPSGATYVMFGEDIAAETDNVLSLQYPKDPVVQRYPGWPPSANEWVCRNRPSGWPGGQLVNSVIKSPVYLVPKGHPQSVRKDFEWRISFSYAEILLSRSFNEAQRSCVLIWKTIYNRLLKPVFKEDISSYHFKNTMYWLSEEYIPNQWHMDNIGELFLKMLDKYISFLSEMYVPMYFIPANNMISHLTNELVAKVIETMMDIRRNPMQYMLYHLNGIPGRRQLPSPDFVKFFEAYFVGAEYETATDHRALYVDQTAMLSTLGKHYFDQSEYHVSISIFKDVVDRNRTIGISETSVNIDALSYLHTASYREDRLDDALKYATQLRTYLLSNNKDKRDAYWQREFREITLELARIHLVLSTKHVSEGEKREHASNTRGLYDQLKEAYPTDINVITEYANYAIHTGQPSESIMLLEDVVRRLKSCLGNEECDSLTQSRRVEMGGDTIDFIGTPERLSLLKFMTTYTLSDRPIIPTSLHKLISSTFKFIKVPTVLLAYHLLLGVYVQTGSSEKAKDLFGEIQGQLKESLFKIGDLSWDNHSVLDICDVVVNGQVDVDDDLDSMEGEYPYDFKEFNQHFLEWIKDMRQLLHQISYDNIYKLLNVSA